MEARASDSQKRLAEEGKELIKAIEKQLTVSAHTVVGRQRERAFINKFFDFDLKEKNWTRKSKILSIVGAPGTGKTSCVCDVLRSSNKFGWISPSDKIEDKDAKRVIVKGFAAAQKDYSAPENYRLVILNGLKVSNVSDFFYQALRGLLKARSDASEVNVGEYVDASNANVFDDESDSDSDPNNSPSASSGFRGLAASGSRGKKWGIGSKSGIGSGNGRKEGRERQRRSVRLKGCTEKERRAEEKGGTTKGGKGNRIEKETSERTSRSRITEGSTEAETQTSLQDPARRGGSRESIQIVLSSDLNEDKRVDGMTSSRKMAVTRKRTDLSGLYDKTKPSRHPKVDEDGQDDDQADDGEESSDSLESSPASSKNESDFETEMESESDSGSESESESETESETESLGGSSRWRTGRREQKDGGKGGGILVAPRKGAPALFGQRRRALTIPQKRDGITRQNAGQCLLELLDMNMWEKRYVIVLDEYDSFELKLRTETEHHRLSSFFDWPHHGGANTKVILISNYVRKKSKFQTRTVSRVGEREQTFDDMTAAALKEVLSARLKPRLYERFTSALSPEAVSSLYKLVASHRGDCRYLFRLTLEALRSLVAACDPSTDGSQGGPMLMGASTETELRKKKLQLVFQTHMSLKSEYGFLAEILAKMDEQKLRLLLCITEALAPGPEEPLMFDELFQRWVVEMNANHCLHPGNLNTHPFVQEMKIDFEDAKRISDMAGEILEMDAMAMHGVPLKTQCNEKRLREFCNNPGRNIPMVTIDVQRDLMMHKLVALQATGFIKLGFAPLVELRNNEPVIQMRQFAVDHSFVTIDLQFAPEPMYILFCRMKNTSRKAFRSTALDRLDALKEAEYKAEDL